MENTVGKSEDSSESIESIGHFPMQLELRRSPSRDNLRESVLPIEPDRTDVAGNEGGSNPTELFRHQGESVYNPTAPPDIDEKRQPKKDHSVDTIKDAVTAIIRAVGEDPGRQGLLATPMRLAEAMLFLTQGYAMTLEDVTNGAIFEQGGSDLVSVKGINVFSLCEHHLLPFFGKVHITYRAKAGPVIGLSKLARIVDMYARRLQIQERLTEQVASAVQQVLEPDGVDVVVECTHMCMAMRGVQQPDAITVTRKSLGVFLQPGATAEVDVLLRKS